ncbi:MAG: hypothetical protein U0457_14540 [Candidatus Sericytochromatia bacterium]
MNNIQNIYILLADENSEQHITIETIKDNNEVDILINNKFLDINGAEKVILFKLLFAMIENNSVNSEDLIEVFKNTTSQVPLKKQLQKAIHNIRNEIAPLLGFSEEKKQEIILTKRKTQYNEDSAYRFYIPDIEIKSYIKDTKKPKNILNFIKTLISYNNEIYFKEILKNFNKLINVLKKEKRFYYIFIEELEVFLKKYDSFLLVKEKTLLDFSKLVEIFEEKFINSHSTLLSNPIYVKSKAFLGCYYSYNFATSGEDKISQSIQKIYINSDNELKIKILNSNFKYYGEIKIDDNFLFINANLINEKSFLHQVLNKPLISEQNNNFFFGSFTAFSVDKTLCFGKIFLIEIDSFLDENEYKNGYIKESSKEYLSNFFSNYFETNKNNTTRIKLPDRINIDLKMIKTDNNKTIDFDWLNT